MKLYDNLEKCPVCGSPLRRIDYYCAAEVPEEGADAQADEARQIGALTLEDIRKRFAGYCRRCAQQARERANAAAAARARAKMRRYLALGVLSAVLAACGVAFEVWCRRSLADIGSERWVLGGLGTFAALAFGVAAGVFFFLRPVERARLDGVPFIEPDYDTLSRSAAIQAAAEHMEDEPGTVFFSEAEYRRMRENGARTASEP